MKLFPVIILSLLLLSIYSCKKDKLYEKAGAQLKFSVDTLKFDTVFTQIGTVTKRFTVKNTYENDLKVSKLYIAKASYSNFRMNVDGVAGLTFSDIIIPAEDSIFIFVEATIDPTNFNSPMVIQDSIVFEVNNNTQDIDLVAWGQDVHLIDGEYIQTATWINDKPYLIYNSMLVDSLNTLTISQGCQLYFHTSSSLYVKGSLNVKGSLEEPVVFQGDRLEEFYDNNPGQWGYIHLLAGSFDNNIDYAIIKNATIGIQVDTVINSNPTLTISNSKIENMSATGLYAQGSSILASNCIFANCGQYAVALNIGGKYEFYHCTIANYWSYETRQTPSLIMNNFYTDVYGTTQLRELDVFFANSIIYGKNDEEIGFSQLDGYDDYFTYKFDHCLLKTEQYTSDATSYIEIITNENPNFISTSEEFDYQLDTLSPAKDVGLIDYTTFYPIDYNGNSRQSDIAPDLGAFERQE